MKKHPNTKHIRGRVICFNLKIFKFVSAFLLMIFTANFSYAQTPLYSFITDVASGLTSRQQEKLDSLRAMPFYDTIVMIQMQPLSIANDSGKLYIEYPNSGGVADVCYAYDIDNPDMIQDPTDFIWNGVFAADSNSDGSLFLMGKDGEMFGTITRFESDEHYEILSFSPGVNALAKINEGLLFSGLCKSSGTQETQSSTNNNEPCPTKKVKILIFYTEAAAAEVANIQNAAVTAYNQLRGAWYNSDDFANLDFELCSVI